LEFNSNSIRQLFLRDFQSVFKPLKSSIDVNESLCWIAHSQNRIVGRAPEECITTKSFELALKTFLIKTRMDPLHLIAVGKLHKGLSRPFNALYFVEKNSTPGYRVK